MRSLTFVDAGRLEWRDQPKPIITGAGQALVCPVAASICGIDCLGGHLDDVALPLFAMYTRGVTLHVARANNGPDSASTLAAIQAHTVLPSRWSTVIVWGRRRPSTARPGPKARRHPRQRVGPPPRPAAQIAPGKSTQKGTPQCPHPQAPPPRPRRAEGVGT